MRKNPLLSMYRVHFLTTMEMETLSYMWNTVGSLVTASLDS